MDRVRSRGVFAGLSIGTIVFAALLIYARPGLAAEGVEVRANANGGDHNLVAVVHVGTAAGVLCSGSVRHGGESASLRPLRTSATGDGRWRWTIGEGATGGRWAVSVSCQLASGPETGKGGFTSSASRGGHGGGELVSPGSMQVAAPEEHTPSHGPGHGRGEGEEENGYPIGQCTWWAELKRQDIPFFPGSAGDALNWARSARRASPPFAVGEAAKPGAIAVFQPGQDGAGPYGHVAYVAAVDGPKMTISEANYLHTKPGHQRALRWRGAHIQFIYARRGGETKTTPLPQSPYEFFVYRTCANGRCGLQQRQGAGLSFAPIGQRLADESQVFIECQTRGERVAGVNATSTDVWDRLTDRAYVSDYFVDTPGKNDQFTEPIPNCEASKSAGQLTPPSPAPPSPSVSVQQPNNGETLTGTMRLKATSDAPGVRFEAFYSSTPGTRGTATWHGLGAGEAAEGGFALDWDTTAVPNQGFRGEGTVLITATALNEVGQSTGKQDTRQVAISNPEADGAYTYHVYGTCLESSCKLKRRAGPGFSEYPQVGTSPDGAAVEIACQTLGQPVSGAEGESDVWDELSDESWASDYYLDTPNAGGFSPPIPRCASVPPPPPPPNVALATPANGSTLSGTVEVSAFSNAAGVRFEAYYSESPGVSGSASWHMLGDDVSPGNGFGFSWDTRKVPNQGQPKQGTVQLRAVALDYEEHPTTVKDTRRVVIANPNADGFYPYHVYGTCEEGECQVNLHSGPGYLSYPVVGSKNEGDEVDIACQTYGETVSDGVSSSNVWDELSNGDWITDFYVDTPVAGNLSPPIPSC